MFDNVFTILESFQLLAMSRAATTVVLNGLPCNRPLVSKNVFKVPITLSFGGVACHVEPCSLTT